MQCKNDSMTIDVTAKASSGAGLLYVVATPIGNLGDMSFRAVETLKRVAVIACEDTRVSRVLCKHYGIDAPLLSYHDYNEDETWPKLLARLQAGDDVALISDAGTPLISDPGYRLVREVSAAGVRVVPLPGACAFVSALSAGGLPTDRFHFSGFLPSKQQARRTALEALARIDATIVLYESGKRLLALLDDVSAIMGSRDVVVARELTKHYEEIIRDDVVQARAFFAARDQVKGELVVCIAPPDDDVVDDASCDALLAALLPHYPVKQVVSLVGALSPMPRNMLYQRALLVKQGD